ncbi:transglycosylase SLT domain-containing protein [Bacillus stercoris]|uniref:transglycosylase SLT domain-containing protein n=1 Tax=Bacillus stercoris TaxID=2054641 RepID=UPI00398B42EC
MTARFDLEDKVSKKLKRIHNGFQMVEKKVKTINRQIKISIKAEDQAFYRLRKINDYIVLKFAKSLEVKVVLDDQATAGLDVIEHKLKRLPKERNITVSLIEHVTDAYKKIGKMLSRNQFSVGLFVNDQITPAIKRILGYLQKNLKNGYSVKLKVIDEITKTVNRITALLSDFEKTYTVKLKVMDEITKNANRITALLRDFEKTYTVNIIANEKLAADKINEKKPEEKKNWFMQTLEDFGTAFKDKVIETILDSLFEKIPGLKKNDNEANTAPGNTQINDKVDKRKTGQRCCCCCCGCGGNSSGSKANKRYKKRKSPTSARNSGRTLRVPGEVLRRRQSGASGESATSGRNSGSKFRNWLGGMRSAATDSSKWGKVLTPLKGLGKFAKGIPLLGTALAATDLLGMNKENAGEKIGSFAGNLGGAAAGGAAGAAIGSVVPVVGTAVGGVVGSIAGGIGGSDLGSSIGKWFDDGGASKAWDGIQDGAADAVDWIKDTWSDFSGWFMDNVWTPVSDWAGDKIDKITEKFEDAKKWLTDTWNDVSSWFVDNVWTPIYNTAVPIINLVVGAFLFAWDGIQALWSIVSTWFIDNVWNPLVDGVTDAADWIWTKINDAWTWISDTWSTVSTWFMDNVWNPISDAVATVAGWIQAHIDYARIWIQLKWLQVATWFYDNVWNPISTAVSNVANWIWTKINEAWTWISDKWSAVSSWFSENVWNPIVSKVEDAKKSISEKFESAITAVKDAWKGIENWFQENVGDPLGGIADGIKEKFQDTFAWVIKLQELAGVGGRFINNLIGRGEEATGLTTKESGKSSSGKNSNGGGGIAGLVQSQSSGPTSIFPKQKNVFEKKATGGYITKPTISWIGEAGKEFVIPVDNNKGRGKMLLSQAASKLGMRVVDDMASASSVGGETAVSPLAGAASVTATVSPTVDTSSLNEQASSFGQQFTQGFDQGIEDKVVSMDAWKQKNVGQPMNNLISYSPNYGKQVVNGYANGQDSTATGTDGFLQTKVKTPFQNTINKSSSWGTGTIKGFASGQNSSQTGTDQYVNTHVNKPFLKSKESSNGWGTGMIGNFVSGMTSKTSEVHEAAKELAKKVEQAFREELDIHSPSRVMMSLGRFASVGVVKGLDSVDVKKYAEKQAGSLAAAYSGMGAVGGNVKQWLMAAMMATKTPLSWLSGLMTIAQYESGGNPNSINLWDSNAKAGNPSQGLMQTVPTTFNAHKAPGMGNIRNPIHNAAAAIGYIKSRYGSIDNVPGIKSLKRGGPYVGYANGGLITKEQIARVGEGNKREWIIPEERGIRGRYLLQRAAQALGMEVTDPSQSQQSELSSGQVSAVTSANRPTARVSGSKEIYIQFNGDQHFHNGQDAESLAAKIKQALIDELQKDINIGTKGVVAFD